MLEQQKKLARLFKAYQKGDRHALKQFCMEIEKIMRPYFEKKVRNAELVRELSQETHSRILQNLPTLKEPMRLTQFVMKVAYHVLQDHYRVRYYFREDEIRDPIKYERLQQVSSRPDLTIDNSQAFLNNIDFEKSLTTLPKKTRQILQLKIDGFTYSEIGRILGESDSAVKMHIKRGYEKIKKKFNLM
ncbi:MAG: sigma-70 family RNA polymerase sigma factor [Caldithrix sp.]|nr:sigma-70 family RNA polymerase sigma factor [Caldithrix sp.]